MSDQTTELTRVPKAPRAAPTPPAPTRRAAPVPPAAASSASAPLAHNDPATRRYEQRLEFTGTGEAYFRVWIFSALLTLATLGVYSAWAKRRKARWFARHTVLAGECFDFHGDPGRILVGRVLALALLVAFVQAFSGAFGAGGGIATIAGCLAAGPLLVASAVRFSLGNTSWRGLRFGFEAGAGRAYAACLPMGVAWVMAAAAVALKLGPLVDGLIALTVAVLLPLAHGRLRQWQHGHARYGALAFDFRLSAGGFYRCYLRLGAILIVAGALAAALAWGSSKAAGLALGADGATDARLATWLPLVAMGLGWMLGWPVYIAGLQPQVWHHTSLDDSVEFVCHLPAKALFKTVLGGGALTLVTLGLYWPFLAVRIARLRVEAMTVRSDVRIDRILVRAPQPRGPGGPGRGKAGEGATASFGLDIGW